MTRKDKIISFVWQHVLLFIALYIMTLGISLCVKSMLGDFMMQEQTDLLRHLQSDNILS